MGAYLAQQHGLTNVRRLRRGIIGYEQWLAAEAGAAAASPPASPPASLFKGVNFVFDERPQPGKRRPFHGPL